VSTISQMSEMGKECLTCSSYLLVYQTISCMISLSKNNSKCSTISLIFSAPLLGPKSQLYRVSQEECARLRDGVPYVKVYRYNPKHLCPKLNGYGDNGQRKVWSSCGSMHCTCQLTILSISALECGVILLQVSSL